MSVQSSPPLETKPPPLDPHLFAGAARNAWQWSQRPKPSIWLETSGLVIPRNSFNAEPGPYSLNRTPWWRGVSDLLFEPDVEQLWIYKGTQIGYTRWLISMIMYIAAHPDIAYAVGLLMPDEDAVEEIFDEEILPTVDQSPNMRPLKTGKAWDTTKREIRLATMPILGLYAGSVQRLARRSLRYVIGDEINKYRTFKEEASPISLLWKRTSNHLHHARGIFGSTPTTPDGNITVGYNKCTNKMDYFVPCPRCGFYQAIQWTQIRGLRDIPGADKESRSDFLFREDRNPNIKRKSIYLECPNCKAEIQNYEKARQGNEGQWAGLGQTVDDGKVFGVRPSTPKIGLRMPSFLSPWLSYNLLMREFVLAEGDQDLTRDFQNSRLALPFEIIVKAPRASIVRDKIEIAPPPPSLQAPVPKWATVVFATVDTQGGFYDTTKGSPLDTLDDSTIEEPGWQQRFKAGWFRLLIRAWGWGFKSQLLYRATVYSFDELYERGLACAFPVEGGGMISPKAMLIDSGGNRTHEVYEFAQRDTRINPIKGVAFAKESWKRSFPRPGVQLWLIDVQLMEHKLQSLVENADPTLWLPHNQVDDDYCQQMASHQLVKVKGKRDKWESNGRTRDEDRDCEIYQVAAAEMEGIAAAPAPPPDAVEKPRVDESKFVNPLVYRR